ncbi:MAG: tRNA (adenosine(37)-N6)-threonylcarbamoyltransferase complex ATPase subunit type 1 TsaE [Pseudomonadota bacterium]
MTETKEIHHLTEPELLAFANDFAATLPTRGAIALWGDLGAGKTTFIRRVIQALSGDPELIVPSPTFTLVQEYIFAARTVWHCDLYRLTDPDECLELGLIEAMHAHLCFIEWPERMGAHLPQDRIDIHIHTIDEQSRELVVIPFIKS